MPPSTYGDSLADQVPVTIILRLVLDRDGKLKYGDLVGVDGERRERFVGRTGLTSALHAWLDTLQEGGHRHPT